MNRPLRLLTLIATACAAYAIGCQPDKSTPPAGPRREKIFVQGDPMELVRGARLDARSPIDENGIDEWNRMRLLAFVTYENQRQADPDRVDLKKETAASTGETETFDATLHVADAGDGEWSLRLLNETVTLMLRRQPDGSLQIEKIEAGGKTVPVKVLHWSVGGADRQYVSVLLRSGDGADRELAAFYFERETRPRPLTTVDKSYLYLAGPGRAIGWSAARSSPLTLEVCGPAGLEKPLREAADAWQAPLQGRLELKVARAETYAPFSEIDQHCVYLIDHYLMDSRRQVIKLGYTSGIQSQSYGEIVDADILMFRAEFEKEAGWDTDPSSRTGAHLAYILTHEMGHVLGLDHQHSEGLPERVPSIMSYEDKTIQKYDVEAIQNLYPER